MRGVMFGHSSCLSSCSNFKLRIKTARLEDIAQLGGFGLGVFEACMMVGGHGKLHGVGDRE